MSPAYGVVCLPALDLRARPDHRSELRSQLLLGEVVRVGAGRRGWSRVTNVADGYGGWVRDWGLVPASARRAGAWARAAVASAAAPLALLRGRPAGGIGVGPLFFGSRAIPGRVSRGWIQLELPDARRGWIERSGVTLPGRGAPAVAERVTSLLGSPYLWGGRTPAGYDCSAFVQQVLLEQGLALPRDAAQQRRRCRTLAAEETGRPGDLGFFADRSGRISHVAVRLSGDLFAHARGRVVLASLDRHNQLYDKELAVQFTGWCRPLGPVRRRPGRAAARFSLLDRAGGRS